MSNHEKPPRRIVVPQEEYDDAKATIEAWRRDIPLGAVSGEELAAAKEVIEEYRTDIPPRAAHIPPRAILD